VKLARIAQAQWDVLAIVDPRGYCQIIDFLDSLEAPYQAAKDSMIHLLTEHLPIHGPPKGEPHCKPLGFGLGKKLRILWFYGKGRVVVCSTAFVKAETTPRIEIERSRLIARQYSAAAERGEIEILSTKGWPT
jgi:hypothetical protein